MAKLFPVAMSVGINSLADAVADQPEGAKCTQCEGVNEFWDDCGFFYVHDEALCEKCYKAGGYTTSER